MGDFHAMLAQLPSNMIHWINYQNYQFKCTNIHCVVKSKLPVLLAELPINWWRLTGRGAENG
jgi:hypothetical protein